MKDKLIVLASISDGPIIKLEGRKAWAILELHAAGPKGCTPIDNPAPRWSAYVHALRKLGFVIETVTEKHGGNFPGDHARYVLHGNVTAAIIAGHRQA